MAMWMHNWGVEWIQTLTQLQPIAPTCWSCLETQHVAYVLNSSPLYCSAWADNTKEPSFPPPQLGGWCVRECGCMCVHLRVYMSKKVGFPITYVLTGMEGAPPGLCPQ